VTNRFGRGYELAAADLQRLMNTIVDEADEDEARDVERLLGVLTSLPAGPDETISFVAPRGTSPLVEPRHAGHGPIRSPSSPGQASPQPHLIGAPPPDERRAPATP
jgi:hypothetical protein